MKKSRLNQLAELRQRAETEQEREGQDSPALSLEETHKLIHELRTHQIELEMQNEELRRAQNELVESHDRYSDLYDFAPIGYVTINHKGLILEANLSLTKMLGVERQSLLKQPFSAFIISDDQNIYYWHRREILESKQRHSCRLRMRRREAEPLWVEMDSILIEADEQNDTCLRTVISDISERKQAEEEKQSFEWRLQQAQKLESLGVLAGGIAHDFNNLLTTILGNAEVALYKLSSLSPARDNLQEIEKASKRAAELANQMLAYSGKGQFIIKPINLRKLVEEMAHLLEVSISKKTVLKYHFASNLPTFDGDVTQIRQVIMNLITNASEAIGDNSGVIALSTGAMHCDRAYLDDVNEALRTNLGKPLPEGVYTYFEVADTGCGMDAETIEKTFDPFFTTKFTGRGLGLSTVLGIMRGHKGMLKIYSAVGKGTIFKVLFPANEPHENGLTVRRKNPSKGKDWCKIGTVLIVDDEDTICAVGRQMLECMGLSVLTAPDGCVALTVLCEHFDEIVCVLLNLTMPYMDGVETFAEIRRFHPGVKVILCSGYNEQEATQRFAGKGLAGFIQKPYKMAVLREKLMAILCDE